MNGAAKVELLFSQNPPLHQLEASYQGIPRPLLESSKRIAYGRGHVYFPD